MSAKETIGRISRDERLEILEHELDERVKELACLHGISRLAEQVDISREELLQGIVNLIPSAMQYPEIACARLTLEEDVVRTDDFIETDWRLGEDVILKERRIGALELYYLEERPENEEGPFQMEERALIFTVCEYLARIIGRMKNEEELRRSEKKYSALVENTTDGIIILQNGEIRFANTASLNLAGYHPEKMVGKNFLDFVAPRSRELVMKRYAARMAGKEVPPIYEMSILKKDGSELPVEVNAGLIEYKEKPADLVFLRDITERKMAENAIRESEEKYRDLFENANDLIQSVDAEGRFDYVNAKWVKSLGYSREEIKNLKLPDIIRKDQLEHCMELFRKVCFGEKVDRVETVFVAKDGSEIDVEGTVSPQIKEGKFISTKAIFRDTTERNKMIMDLETTNEELRATQSHLIQSGKLASIGMLASGIAHEINNPLAAITGYAEAIMDEDDVKLKTDYAAKILSASGRASEVVRWLSKHSRDAKVDTVGDVQLNDVLNDSLESVRLAKPSPDIEIRKNFEEVPLIEGNKNEIQQIFVNLVNNATDAMPDGGRLLISTSIENGCVKASITDTGGGIPKDHLTKIFDPFFTTKEVGEGTGLGLYVTSMIVLRHQGRMEVESEVGKGTVFTVRFPIKGKMNGLGNNRESAKAGT